MLSEAYMPLTRAAKLCGVTAKTMKRWLEMEGFVFLKGGGGMRRRPLVAESDVKALIAKRAPTKRWMRIERKAS